MLKAAAILLATITTADAAQTGLASVYWENDGSAMSHRIVSGAHFNPHALTAAHRTLPLGTLVQVTNKLNGEMVYLKVNDRGPCAPGGPCSKSPKLVRHFAPRIIDLTPEAADRIHLHGLGPVIVRVCTKPNGVMVCV